MTSAFRLYEIVCFVFFLNKGCIEQLWPRSKVFLSVLDLLTKQHDENKIEIVEAEARESFMFLADNVLEHTINGNHSTEFGQCYISSLQSHGWVKFSFQLAQINRVSVLNRAETGYSLRLSLSKCSHVAKSVRIWNSFFRHKKHAVFETFLYSIPGLLVDDNFFY